MVIPCCRAPDSRSRQRVLRRRYVHRPHTVRGKEQVRPRTSEDETDEGERTSQEVHVMRR